MRNKQIKFTYCSGGYISGLNLRLCSDALHEWFVFPYRQATIIMEISEQPSAQAAKVEDNDYSFMRLYLHTKGGRKETTIVYTEIKEALQEFGFPCYVSLKY